MLTSKNAAVIVFDIGGTFFRYNVFCVDRRWLEDSVKNKVVSPSIKVHPDYAGKKLAFVLVEKIVAVVEAVKKRHPGICILGVGISFPGPVDPLGRVLSAPPLWGNKVKNYPLKKKLEDRLPYNVYVLNDVSAGCWFYHGRIKISRFCLITVSTGIGSKVYDTGHRDLILNSAQGMGGEIGHAFVAPTEYKMQCDCGSIGHLSAISSGRGTENFARKHSRIHPEQYGKSKLTLYSEGNPSMICNEHLIKAIKNKDAFALEILEKTSWYLANVMQQIHLMIGVDRFIIVGGFAWALGGIYRGVLVKHLKRIGVWGLEPKKLARFIQIGANDDMMNLRGMGEYVFWQSGRIKQRSEAGE